MNWHQTHELDNLYSKSHCCDYKLLSNAYGHFFLEDFDLKTYDHIQKVKKIVNSDDLKIGLRGGSFYLIDASTQDMETAFCYVDEYCNDDEKQKFYNALLSKLTDIISTSHENDDIDEFFYYHTIFKQLNLSNSNKKLDPAILDKLMDECIKNNRMKFLISHASNFHSVHFQFLDNEKYCDAFFKYYSNSSQNGILIQKLKDLEISENYDGIMSLLNNHEFNSSYVDLLSKDTLKKISEKLIKQFAEDRKEYSLQKLTYLNIIAKALSVEEFTNLIRENKIIYKTTKDLISLYSNYGEFKIFFWDIFKSLMQSDDPIILELLDENSLVSFPPDVIYPPEFQKILVNDQIIRNKFFGYMSRRNFDPEYYRENHEIFTTRDAINYPALEYKDSTPARKIYTSNNLREVKMEFPEVEILNLNLIEFSVIKEKLKFFPNLKFIYYVNAPISSQELEEELGQGNINFIHYPDSIKKPIPKPKVIEILQVKVVHKPLIKYTISEDKLVSAGEQLRPSFLEDKIFYVRNSQSHLEIDGVDSIDVEWMPNIPRDFVFKQLGDSLVDSQVEEPRLITDWEKFSRIKQEKFNNFEFQGSETLASFNMEISGNNQISELLSISPDNKISAIFCKDPTVTISYYRSDDGFYFLKSDKACEIYYLISGQEPKNIDITEDLDSKDLPPKILEILNRYKQGKEIKMSISNLDVSLPDYEIDLSTDLKTSNQKWLEEVFKQPNKSSCRHRVLSVASEFGKQGLRPDKDYRIIAVNNNHVLFEIKNNDGDWVRVDMGGSDVTTTKDIQVSETYKATFYQKDKETIHEDDGKDFLEQFEKKEIDDDEKTKSLNKMIHEIAQHESLEKKIREKEKETNISVETICYTQKYTCFRCLTFLFTKKPKKINLSGFSFEELTNILESYEHESSKGQSSKKMSLMPIVSADPPNVSGLPESKEKPDDKSKIDSSKEKLNIDFKKIFDNRIPNIFLTSRVQTVLDEDPSSQPAQASVSSLPLHPSSKTALSALDLVSSDFTVVMNIFLQREDKKSLLLQSSSIQELKNYIIAWRVKADQETSAKTSSIFLVDSPQELKLSSKTIEIEGISQVESYKARAILNSKLKQFIEGAKGEDQVDPKILLIDWAKFSDKEKVAFNTIFDASREIDGVKIPDSIKIVCIDSSKGQSSDTSIASRFSECYNLVASAFELKDQTNLLIKDAFQDESQEKSQIAIDLAGYPNWQDKLFGAITLQKDQLFWQKTDFVKAIEDGCTKFKLSNIQKSDRDSLIKMLDTAKARGYIDYHGYQIKISPNFNISFDTEEFKIADVLEKFQSSSGQNSGPSLKIYRDIKLTASNELKTSFKIDGEKHELIVDSLDDSNINLINTLNFDKLLTIPKLDKDNKYYEESGLIEKASKKDKVLKLFITNELSTQQNYYLLAKCAEEGVNLQLYLAGDVELSFSDKSFNADIASEFLSQNKSGNTGIVDSPSQVQEQVSPARILVTNDANLALGKMLSGGNFSDIKPLIINSEDENYASLFGGIHSEVSVSTHEKFSEEIKFEFLKKTSELLEILRSGRQIVIKGKFSEQLMQNLHSFMAGIKDKELDYLDPASTSDTQLSNQDALKNLLFIIEDKNLQKTSQSCQYSILSFLDQELLTVEYHEPAIKQQKEIIAESKKQNHQIVSGDSGTINSSCESFMRVRKGLLTTHLIDSSSKALALISDAGSGKTALIDEIAENGLKQKGDVKIFKELDNIEAWARDNSDDTTKILVIDEFNIDGTRNFTTFTDFVLGKTNTIFYQGKELVLSDKHKILFLGNPIEYGNRYSQKLFSDCDIMQIKLENFPADYIYQKILKEPIYQPIQDSQDLDKSFEISSQPIISEDQFKQICQSKIDQYYKNLAKYKQSAELASQTVRKLQEEVLFEVAKEIKKSKAKTSKEVRTEDFVATKVNGETIDKIQQAIDIRKYQQQGLISDKCVGTPGIILEGDSGVGKSVMVEAILQSNNISRLDRIDATTRVGSQYYYKIPANADKKTIEETLIKAFEKGIIVVMDEINTRLDEGLEKLLNSLLTGKHPNKIGENARKITPGFMLISSINSSSHAGRADLSPALLSRCHHIKAKTVKEYGVRDFEEILSNWFESDKEKSRYRNFLTSFGNLTQDHLQCSSSLVFAKGVNQGVSIEIDASKQRLFEETAQKFIKEFAIECEDNKYDRNFNLRTLRGKYLDYLLEFAKQKQIDRIQECSSCDKASVVGQQR